MARKADAEEARLSLAVAAALAKVLKGYSSLKGKMTRFEGLVGTLRRRMSDLQRYQQQKAMPKTPTALEPEQTPD
jgi:hypothetical protein